MKKDRDKIILNKTAQQLSSRAFSEFWKTIKKIKGTDHVVSNVLDGEYTDRGISNKFLCIYDELYNSVPDNSFKDIIDEVNNLVTTPCNNSCCKSPECHYISIEIVNKTIQHLNTGKMMKYMTLPLIIL